MMDDVHILSQEMRQLKKEVADDAYLELTMMRMMMRVRWYCTVLYCTVGRCRSRARKELKPEEREREIDK